MEKGRSINLGSGNPGMLFRNITLPVNQVLNLTPEQMRLNDAANLILLMITHRNRTRARQYNDCKPAISKGTHERHSMQCKGQRQLGSP